MDRSTFRDYEIKRTYTEFHQDYKDYIPALQIDFKNRCAYCNTLDSMITESFSVDHFVPRKEFEKAGILELDADYNNLMYCCPKCNKVKSSQFLGVVSKNEIKNELFYNPVETDYGKIFYRDIFGGISSKDSLGKDMIVRLKLYSPIFNLIYLSEVIDDRLEKIENLVEKENNSLVKTQWNEVYMKLNKFSRELRNIICMNYYDAKTLDL